MIISTKQNTRIEYGELLLKTEKPIKADARLFIYCSEYFEPGLSDDQMEFIMRNRIWFKIYGDLIEPIRKLEMHARHNCLPHNFLVLEKLIEEINQLIATPK